MAIVFHMPLFELDSICGECYSSNYAGTFSAEHQQSMRRSSFKKTKIGNSPENDPQLVIGPNKVTQLTKASYER